MRAATRSPEGALRTPRLAVQGRGEAGATAWWRSPARGGGWLVQSASPRECVRRGPVPGLRGPKRTATPGTRASGLSPDTSPAAFPGAVIPAAGPAEVCWAGQAPPGLRAGSCGPVAVCPSVRACVRRERGEARGGVRTAAAAREAEPPPAFPCSPPPGSGCRGAPPSLEGRILG